MSRRIGYVRINPHRTFGPQLVSVHLDKIYKDVAGARDARPQRDALMAELREGDTVVVEKLGILSPDPRDLQDLFIGLFQAGRGIALEVIQDSLVLDPSNRPELERALGMFSATMEFLEFTENEEIQDRFARAKKRGTTKRDQLKRLTDEQIEQLRARHRAGMSKASLAKEFGVSRPTVDRYVSESQE